MGGEDGQRHINQAGLDLIKNAEGFSAVTYICPAGKPTIGYGHVVNPGEHFDEPISQEQAEELLANDLGEAEAGVSRLVRVPLNDNQFSALVSFTFNLGAGNLGDSTLLRLLNAGDYAGAAGQFPRWCHAGGQVLEGLVKRRQAEADLFLA